MSITFRTTFFRFCSGMLVALVALAVVGTAGWASAQDKAMAGRLEAALDRAMNRISIAKI